MDLEQICSNHPDRKALSLCHHCGRYFCHECLKEGSDFYYCEKPECLHALEAELHPPAPSVAGPLESPGTPPENLVFLALYPHASEANAVKAKLGLEGLECFPVEASCGLMEDPFIVPVWLRVRAADGEKAARILKNLPFCFNANISNFNQILAGC